MKYLSQASFDTSKTSEKLNELYTQYIENLFFFLSTGIVYFCRVDSNSIKILNGTIVIVVIMRFIVILQEEQKINNMGLFIPQNGVMERIQNFSRWKSQFLNYLLILMWIGIILIASLIKPPNWNVYLEAQIFNVLIYVVHLRVLSFLHYYWILFFEEVQGVLQTQFKSWFIKINPFFLEIPIQKINILTNFGKKFIEQSSWNKMGKYMFYISSIANIMALIPVINTRIQYGNDLIFLFFRMNSMIFFVSNACGLVFYFIFSGFYIKTFGKTLLILYVIYYLGIVLLLTFICDDIISKELKLLQYYFVIIFCLLKDFYHCYIFKRLCLSNLHDLDVSQRKKIFKEKDSQIQLINDKNRILSRFSIFNSHTLINYNVVENIILFITICIMLHLSTFREMTPTMYVNLYSFWNAIINKIKQLRIKKISQSFAIVKQSDVDNFLSIHQTNYLNLKYQEYYLQFIGIPLFTLSILTYFIFQV